MSGHISKIVKGGLLPERVISMHVHDERSPLADSTNNCSRSIVNVFFITILESTCVPRALRAVKVNNYCLEVLSRDVTRRRNPYLPNESRKRAQALIVGISATEIQFECFK